MHRAIRTMLSLGRDLATGLTAGVLFFVPFGLFALGSTIYLWRRRALFFPKHLCGGCSSY